MCYCMVFIIIGINSAYLVSMEFEDSVLICTELSTFIQSIRVRPTTSNPISVRKLFIEHYLSCLELRTGSRSHDCVWDLLDSSKCIKSHGRFKAPYSLVRNFFLELGFKGIQVVEVLLHNCHKIAISGSLLVSMELASLLLSCTTQHILPIHQSQTDDFQSNISRKLFI